MYSWRNGEGRCVCLLIIVARGLCYHRLLLPKLATIGDLGQAHCLSKTNVELNGFPSPFVPFVVVVIVLPSLETTVRPVALYCPPVFFRVSVKVLAFSCLMAI